MTRRDRARVRLSSLEASRRIAANAASAAAVAELRGQPEVVRVRTCAGPLPGIYRRGDGRRPDRRRR